MTTELGLFIKDEKVVVSSRKVADVFEKEHRGVMRAIRNLECDEEFSRCNFALTEFKDVQNKTQPEYLMTRDGFTILAMGFTGKKAMEFKLKYIAAFNEMEKRIQRGITSIQGIFMPNFSDPVAAALAWAENEKQKQLLAAKVEADKPKVLFADSVASSTTDILIGGLAKLLKQNGIDIGQNRLFKWLRKHDYLIKTGDNYNMPTQKAMEMNLFRVKESSVVMPDGSIRVTKTTKVTGKGQIYFINQFLNKGGLQPV